MIRGSGARRPSAYPAMPEKKRVLVIDDEQMARDLLRSILEGQGCIVSVAEDGESGLEEIAANPPDLVLLDLTMQGLSGWGVINRLRSHASPPPVIAMSGLGDEEPPELVAIGHFVHGYLSKPFRADQVATACARVLSLTDPASSETLLQPERRTDVRRDLVMPATLSSRNGTPVAVGEVLNITTSGAQFNLGASLPPGAEMLLSFELPRADGPFLVSVLILWSDARRLGLVFVDLFLDDKVRLTELLSMPAPTLESAP